jgi:hypothetical protein
MAAANAAGRYEFRDRPLRLVRPIREATVARELIDFHFCNAQLFTDNPRKCAFQRS